MKKKSKKAVKKEDKTKYDKFKVKKAKSKAKAKSKPKVKPKAKPKAKVVGNFDTDSDWRLKEVHHDINKVRKSVYDLSLNDEGEHDDIAKKIQRCSDSISLLQEWVMSRDVSKRLDDLILVGKVMQGTLEDFRDRMEMLEGYVHKMSMQIGAINGKMFRKDPRKQVDELLQINTDED